MPELFACLRARARLDLLVIDLQLPGGKGTDLLKTIARAAARRRCSSSAAPSPTPRNVRRAGALPGRAASSTSTTPTHILSALAPHLFPDFFNAAPAGVALSVTVSLRVDNVIASAVSANVSKGGSQLRR